MQVERGRVDEAYATGAAGEQARRSRDTICRPVQRVGGHDIRRFERKSIIE